MTQVKEKLLRAPLARERLGNISNSCFYGYIKLGLIKPGVPIGPRLKGWPESEIDEFIQSRISSRDQKKGGAA